jgi:hypothetical protein
MQIILGAPKEQMRKTHSSLSLAARGIEFLPMEKIAFPKYYQALSEDAFFRKKLNQKISEGMGLNELLPLAKKLYEEASLFLVPGKANFIKKYGELTEGFGSEDSSLDAVFKKARQTLETASATTVPRAFLWLEESESNAFAISYARLPKDEMASFKAELFSSYSYKSGRPLDAEKIPLLQDEKNLKLPIYSLRIVVPLWVNNPSFHSALIENLNILLTP